MKQWFEENKLSILAMLITIITWLVVAYVVPDVVINVITAFSFGWFVLGGVVQPWIEHKLQKLFE